MTQSWLNLQCSMLSGINAALVLPANIDGGTPEPCAVWPKESLANPRLSLAAQRAIVEKRDISESRENSQIIACPLHIAGQFFGVVALQIAPCGEAQKKAIIQTLRWGGFWLELLQQQQQATTQQHLLSLFELVEESLAHHDFSASATAVATQLATQLNCQRVSIGMVKHEQMQIEAVSQNSQLEKKSALLLNIAACMDEAMDQDATLSFPAVNEDDIHITTAHEQLTSSQGGNQLCTVLITHDKKIIGAICLERKAKHPFNLETIAFCETAAATVGPILDLKRREQRGIIAQIGSKLKTGLKHLFGSGHLVLKTLSTITIMTLVLASLISHDYRIDAEAVLKGTIQRSIAAPTQGFISEALVRPGDIVTKNQLMCRLDDKDLQLQKVKWLSEGTKIKREYREALAKHDSTQVTILRAKQDQADAELALVEEKLKRTTINAPISGIVVTGDLSHSLGVPVERGQTLFEIAPLNSYRVELNVDEKDIGMIATGQKANLVLTSQPDKTHPFIIHRITPISTAENGNNFFKVEGHLENNTEALRPGMQGVGKILTGEHRLIWIASRRIIDWLHLKLWSWGW